MSAFPSREEILTRVDLVELLGSLTQLPVKVRGNRGQSACSSSTHAQTGATPPVSIDLARGLWSCHGCGAGGTAIDALMVAGDLDRAGAMIAARTLAGLSVDDWPLPSPPPRLVAPTRPPVALTPLDNAAVRLAEYAESRRWRVEILERLGVHVARYGANARLVIPAVADELDYGWQARAIHPRVEPRWLTGAPLRVPFGIDLVDRRPGPVLVVEGASDYVTACHLAAVCPSWPATIAAPGASSWRDGWATLLAGRTVIVTGDCDTAGSDYVARVVADCDRHGIDVCTSHFADTGDLSDLLGPDHGATAERLLEVLAASCVDITAKTAA